MSNSAITVNRFETGKKELWVDLTIYSRDTQTYELTIDRGRVEREGIDWKTFSKAARLVLEELEIKGEASHGTGM